MVVTVFVALGAVSFFLRLLDLGPRQCLFGENSALEFNQTKANRSVSLVPNGYGRLPVNITVAALGSPNVAVKKQVFEILAAISVYSKDGYARALQVLDKFKVSVYL